MALLILHGVLIITAVVLFLSKTEHSLLGSAWQAVAQVSSSDTMNTMQHASNMTDLEVKQFLRMNSCGDNEVVLKQVRIVEEVKLSIEGKLARGFSVVICRQRDL